MGIPDVASLCRSERCDVKEGALINTSHDCLVGVVIEVGVRVRGLGLALSPVT